MLQSLQRNQQTNCVNILLKNLATQKFCNHKTHKKAVSQFRYFHKINLFIVSSNRLEILRKLCTIEISVIIFLHGKWETTQLLKSVDPGLHKTKMNDKKRS